MHAFHSRMHSIILLLAALLLTACAAPDDGRDDTQAAADDAGDAAPLACRAPERVAILAADIDEASGIAPVRSTPGSFWVINDSEGKPALYGLRPDGTIAARVALPPSVRQEDWEDLATAPCASGDCIYIADIGDNHHARDDIAILRLREPPFRDGAARDVERFAIRYPDGAHDAEAIFVLPGEAVYIVTKGRDGPVTVFRYPGALRPGTATLVPVQRLTDGLAQLPDLVTGGASTSDGAIIALRRYARLDLFRLDGDTLAHTGSADLTPAAEPQGEGISVAADGTFTLVSEIGPLKASAPLTRLRCTLP